MTMWTRNKNIITKKKANETKSQKQTIPPLTYFFVKAGYKFLGQFHFDPNL